MRLWRISNFADLSGEGGLRASGRWHTKGRRIVYLADQPASALLEILVHFEIDEEDFPTNYQLIGAEVPDDIAIGSVPERELPLDWRKRQTATRILGDSWLRQPPQVLMRVPSAIVPESRNYLLNPSHVDASKIVLASVV